MATIDNRLPTEGTQIDIEARLGAIETALASLMADTTGQSIATAITGLSGTISPAASNVTYDNTDSSLSASNVKAALDELDDEKVSKAGDTMTGDLLIDKATPAVRMQDENLTVSTSATNGLAEETSSSIIARDAATQFYARARGLAKTDGSIEFQLTARNMNTSGSRITNSFNVGVKKDGTKYYSVEDAAAFRNAIGLESWSVNNGTFANLVQNNHAYVIIANRVNASEGCILLANMSSNVIKVTEVFKSSTFSYTTDNTTGTITITRSGSTASVYARAFLIY